MARPPPKRKPKKTTTTTNNNNNNRFRGSAEGRSAYFARREAANVLKKVLQGDARRRAVGSIKTLVYAPSVRNKKATFALVCETLKYLPVLKDILPEAGVLMTGKWKRHQELIYVTAYDMLFGQKSSVIEGGGPVEKYLAVREKTILKSLAQLLVRKKIKCPEDLVLNGQPSVVRPRYVRVNTLKYDVSSAIQELEKICKVKKDDVVPDLLVLPAGTDLHDHPLVVNGSVFLQGKASSMPAFALNPKPGWKVLDACAAPGNKTIQLAAIMDGKGEITACELNDKRVLHLKDTIKRSGASNVTVFHGDFLGINPKDPLLSKIQAILLDPSCSGSGTSIERLDHLLPSSEVNDAGKANNDRIWKLASFQKKALAHALSFPAVERVVYSTCSLHQMENEDVVMSALPLATSLNFNLISPFPKWPHRGLPVFEGSEKLLRTDPAEGMDGFFIALFVKKREAKKKTRQLIPYPYKMHAWLRLHKVGRKKRGRKI